MLFGFYESSGVFQILRRFSAFAPENRRPLGPQKWKFLQKKKLSPKLPASHDFSRATNLLVSFERYWYPFRGWLDVPLPTYPYGKSLYKPYITWVFMGFFIPKNPQREHQLDTVRVDVRERGTPNCQLWITPPKFNSSPLKNGGWKTILSY